MRHIPLRNARLVAFASLMIVQAGAQSPSRPVVPSMSARPLKDLSIQLQELYGKVITYEEPLLVWRGDLEPEPGQDGNRKWGLFPRTQRFLMPTLTDSRPDLAAALDEGLQAYHQQSASTRFRILPSSWGYHIVPVQGRDETGAVKPVTSALDAQITVPSGERSPREHLVAFGAAVSSASGIRVEISAVPGSPQGFDLAFRAQPPRFSWGADSMAARDALINLLGRSATTFSWRLLCQPSARAEDRFCVLNLGMIEVVATDSTGNPVKRVLRFDRCGDCPPLVPVAPSRSQKH